MELEKQIQGKKQTEEQKETKETGPYLLLPPLSAKEYAMLKADIRIRGVQVPIELDECRNVLDGKHRNRACIELGIQPPYVVRTGLSEHQKIQHLLNLNLRRRHIAKADLKKIALNLREKGWTQDQIAGGLNISQKTVSNWLAQFRNFSELKRVTGKDGKSYPPKKKERVDRLGSQISEQPSNVHKTNSADATTVLEEFRENRATIQNLAVDLILTHPPVDHPQLWEELAIFAKRVLKPGKLFVLYTRQDRLAENIGIISKYLQYVWTGSLVLSESTELSQLHIHTGCRLLLFFAAPPYTTGPWFNDTIWEEETNSQESGMASLIEELTSPGEMICDPFGDDRIAATATRLNRRFISTGKNCTVSPELPCATKTLPSSSQPNTGRSSAQNGIRSFEEVIAAIKLRMSQSRAN